MKKDLILENLANSLIVAHSRAVAAREYVTTYDVTRKEFLDYLFKEGLSPEDSTVIKTSLGVIEVPSADVSNIVSPSKMPKLMAFLGSKFWKVIKVNMGKLREVLTDDEWHRFVTVEKGTTRRLNIIKT